MSRIFRTAGPVLETESHLYVERAEDKDVASEVRRGECVTLIGPRQMGKTSLLLRLRRQLLEEGHIPVYLDLSPARGREQEAWYRYLQRLLQRQLERENDSVTVPTMRDHGEFHEALPQISRQVSGARQVVILLDEVSAVPGDISDGFFSTIRAVFMEREPYPEYRRYVFVLAGTFIPDQLVTDPANSPFNQTTRVYTSDASQEKLARLVRNLEQAGYSVSEDVIRRIYGWTDGHLYLAQRLCSTLEGTGRGDLTTQDVDAAVDSILGDQNIGHVYRSLDRTPEAQQYLEQILAGNRPLRFSRASSLIAELELIGVIKEGSDGLCRLRNDIYRRALGEKYPDLRTDAAGELTELEQKLYDYFCKNINRTCPRSEIAIRIWGENADKLRGIDERVFRLVSRLRERLKSDPASTLEIITRRGVGYKPQRRP